MIKFSALLVRRPDISDEQFHEHWSTIHADHAKRITGIQRYVQSHRIDRLPGVRDSIYAGVAEVWLADIATAVGMADDPGYVNYAQADEANFIDLERWTRLMLSEHVVRGGPRAAQGDPCVKAILLVRGRSDLEHDKFAEAAVAVGPAIASAVPAANRVVVCTTHPDAYEDQVRPAFDAVVELSFDDRQEFDRVWGAAQGDVIAAIDAIADPVQSVGLLAEELRVIWPEEASDRVLDNY